jgi:hypothetical protein
MSQDIFVLMHPYTTQQEIDESGHLRADAPLYNTAGDR